MLDSCKCSARNTRVSLQGGGEAANAELFSEPNQTGRNDRERGKQQKDQKGSLNCHAGSQGELWLSTYILIPQL